MSTHLVAWSESIDQATLGRITTVQDDVLTPDGTDRFIVPPEYNFIRWAIATGPNLDRARIVAPSLDTKASDLDIVPRQDGSNTLTLTSPQIFVPLRPIPLDVSESLEVQTSESGATTRQNVVIALGTQEVAPMPLGEIIVVRATGSTTLTAFAWTAVTLTFETALPRGQYAVVGMIGSSASAIAVRMHFTGGGFRPGVPGLAGTEVTAEDMDPAMMNVVMGYMFGTFTHRTLPQVDYLAGAADTSETVHLYIIKVGEAI